MDENLEHSNFKVSGNCEMCKEKIEETVKSVIDDYGHGEAHIFNLGHGITQFTDPAKVTLMLDVLKEYSKKYH